MTTGRAGVRLALVYLALAMFALGLASSAARAEDEGLTGNDILAWCTSADAHARHGCFMYVMGVYHATGVTVDGVHVPLCIPDNVTGQQAHDVVLKYLRENPAKRNTPAAGVIILALGTAFPCKVKP
jgi:Rap1a immunity proteins